MRGQNLIILLGGVLLLSGGFLFAVFLNGFWAEAAGFVVMFVGVDLIVRSIRRAKKNKMPVSGAG